MSRFDDHIQELLRGAAVASVLKILAAGLTFSMHVVLARLLGTKEFGIFFIAFTIVLITAAISRIGMESALTKLIASNVAIEQPGKVLGIYRKGMLYTLLAGVILSIFLYLLSPWLGRVVFVKPELTQPLAIMALAVVPLALLTLHAHALQGLLKTAASISLLSVYIPLLTCLFAISFVPTYGLNGAAWGYLFATIVTLLIGRWFWEKATCSLNQFLPYIKNKEIFVTSIPMFGIVIMNMIINWFPMLFIGIWEPSKNAGIYSAANRAAMLISFVLTAVGSIAVPKFAALYQQGDMEVLASLVRKSTQLMILFAFPILLLFMIFPEFILSFFGEEFKVGKNILLLLAIGQFINVSTGASAQLLNMTGNERVLRNHLVICTILAFVLGAFFISNYGIIGAAISSSLIMVFQNVILVFYVKKILNITIV
ncbi:MAG: flippase [Candidatus Electrothrix communis]|nr:MAG: flippase [Candidatus Electrothrix communis]